MVKYLGNDSSLALPNDYNGECYIINDRAFYSNDKLISITIPDSVTSIGDYAFYQCAKLVEIINKSSLKIVKGTWDYNRVGYNALNIKTEGESEIVIKDDYLFYTFNNTNYLMGYIGNETSLVLPDDYNGEPYEIYKYAFYECGSLTSITIPDSVTNIGDNAFKFCDKLQYNEYDNAYYLGNENNPYLYLVKAKSYDIKSCIINENCKFIAGYAFNSHTNILSITIPASITSIGSSAFLGCEYLVEVINKSSLNITTGSKDNGYIGYYALNIKTEGESEIVNKDDYLFYTVNNINYLLGYRGNDTVLVLPNDYNGESYEIYKYAFYYCSSLTSITIPNSVTSIGDYAFYNCYNLTSVTIGNSLTSIGDTAFEYCDKLQYNEYDNAYYLGNENNPYMILVKAKSYDISTCVINENCKFILENAFENCNNLQYNEYDNAYYLGNENNPYMILIKASSTSITSCIINNNCKFIHSSAFENCKKLTSIIIPDSVTSLGYRSFYGCKNLLSLTIGNGVTSIGDYAFNWGHSDGSYAYYNGNVDGWKHIIGVRESYYFRFAKMYYYSETKPTDTTYNYWHYVDGEPTAW